MGRLTKYNYQPRVALAGSFPYLFRATYIFVDCPGIGPVPEMA